VTWSTEVANWVTDASKLQLEDEQATAATSSVVEKFSNEIVVLEAALAERRREITDLELALVTAKSEIKDLTSRLEDAQERATGRDRAREVEFKNLELELEKARSETNDLLMLYNENLCSEQIGISKIEKGLSGSESFVATQMTCLRYDNTI
jgi:predicted  nucleic acid-binding Zn-ribbon protein